MKLRVQYTGQLRTAVGRSEDELELPEATTVPLLLRDLAVRLGGQAAAHLSTSAGQIPCGLLVVVNGAAIAASHASETRLSPGDTVTLLPPIAGG
jgi:molybdopterin converting factor small subunit